MAILESIAAANAAYSVIRTALSNGKETASLMGSIGKFLTAEEDIKSAVERKKKSPLTAITGGEQGDWEEFQALEDIEAKTRSPNSRAGAACTRPAAHGIAGYPMKPRCARSALKRRRRQPLPERSATSRSPRLSASSLRSAPASPACTTSAHTWVSGDVDPRMAQLHRWPVRILSARRIRDGGALQSRQGKGGGNGEECRTSSRLLCS